MPLKPGSSRETISANIKEFHTGPTYAHTLRKFGPEKARKQAIAVAMNSARKYRKADGGEVEGESWSPDDIPLPQPRPNIQPQPDPLAGTIANIRHAKGMDALPPQPGEQSLTEYHPTFRENLAAAMLGDNPSPARREFVSGLTGSQGAGTPSTGLIDWLPGVGQAIQVQEAAQHGEPTQAAIAMMPGAGEAKPLQKAAVKGAEYAADVILPQEVAKFTKIGPQSGSNPGGFYQAPTGEKYYIKTPKSEDHVNNEMLAAKLYQAVGVPVAEIKKTTLNGKPAIASPLIEGNVLHMVHPSEYPSVKGLTDHFPADAWLANYDAVGTGHDNVIINKNGAHRIDMGGSLRYRAQGKPKDNFGPEVTELQTMRDPTINPWAAKVFGDQPAFERDTAERIAALPDQTIRDLVYQYGPSGNKAKGELADTLIARRDNIAKAYGIEKETPGGPSEGGIGNVTSLDDQIAELLGPQLAKAVIEQHRGDPGAIANSIFNYADKHGESKASHILKNLPDDLVEPVNEHIAQIAKDHGYSPWGEIDFPERRIPSSLSKEDKDYAEYLAKQEAHDTKSFEPGWVPEPEFSAPRIKDNIKLMNLNKTHSADQFINSLKGYNYDEIPVGGVVSAKQKNKIGDVLNAFPAEELAKAMKGMPEDYTQNIMSWVYPAKAAKLTDLLEGQMKPQKIPDVNAISPEHSLEQVIGAVKNHHWLSDKVQSSAIHKAMDIFSAHTPQDIAAAVKNLPLSQLDNVGGFMGSTKFQQVKDVLNSGSLGTKPKWEQDVEYFKQYVKPLDWQSYKPKEAETFRQQLNPLQIKKIEQLGFNPDVKLYHGGNMPWGEKNHLESNIRLPEEFKDPAQVKKNHESAFFMAHDPNMANAYGHLWEPLAARAPKAMKVDWESATGQSDYSGTYMRKLIEAARQEGADLLVLDGVHDIHTFGSTVGTQYAIINPAVLRSPKHAKFDPDKLHLARPLAGLAGGGLFTYGTVKGQSKENEMNRGGQPKHKAGGGAADSWMMHQASRNLHYEGMIKSAIPGRTDKLPMSVRAGSYIIPADIPSALGQGNSVAGGQILSKMFKSGPYGLPAPRGGGGGLSGARMSVPRPLSPRMPRGMFADGGDTGEDEGDVQIIAAGGEYVIPPEVVKELGSGDMSKGHRVLDEFVLHTRREHIKTLKKLKPPKK